ncbi:PREDICTED: stearoyl-CoA desaturase 5-like [Acromyrmex echinatior]|uniref:Stearoyl-CoA desaturase 5 n=1 Tax=Acromyrmex echinatior TaxID=103372 RepID=F4WI38_ACREC|nr:PREDICTED: stearoyl-CoA desaturase 5-like [Acromyrmex echinatior]XP_011053250.1 PREDICTED: stearoyl-CoA desaturase 5-like [Acromyrmex echinatior]XP_011053251.1 PREDICTED: stearoyl-CoA desaturase 5-like [Acromyrmex echinatior]EGI66131.1 Stearoyl-CoA desaturase 5 [Acromyrmex echinatior]
MAPNILSTDSKTLTEKDLQNEESSIITKTIDKNNKQNRSESYIKRLYEDWFKTEPKWFNIVSICFFHLSFVYSCFTFNFFENLMTTAWLCWLIVITGFGITGGVHRLWTHRSYKAKWQLRIILAICYVTAGMNDIFEWVRDHRVHHKYTDTNSDPHNSRRGFFFSHVGWLMMKKHPDVIRCGREIDMSDILADPIAVFAIKYFSILKLLFAFLLPMMIPVYAWNETWSRAFVSQIFIRYVFVLNITWSVNSVAHIWGPKPYDAELKATQSLFVNYVTGGEGSHNYHHTFPWDYKASEFNEFLTTQNLNFFSKIGWAYDFKEASKELVKTVAMNRGDGSHSLWKAVPYPASKIE